MRRNWIAGGLGALGMALIGYASLSDPGTRLERDELGLLASPSDYPHEPMETLVEDETAGEVPLFESRLPAPALATVAEGLEVAPRAGAFEQLPQDHWIVQAIQDVFPDRFDPARGGELPEQVTRYQLAVTLARTFELYEQQSQQPTLDAARVALLEKMTGELRNELAMLGVDRGRTDAQIESMTARLGRVEGGLAEQGTRIASLEKQVQSLTARLENQRAETARLGQRVTEEAQAREGIEKRTGAMSDVLGRIVVKSSVTQARLGRLEGSAGAGAVAPSQAGAVVALARRVEKLESEPRTEGVAAGAEVAQRMSERLRRMERLVVRAYAQRSKEGKDSTDLDAMRQSIGHLARRLEDIEQRPSPVVLQEKALGDVKVLLKDFFTDFDGRLGVVEKKVF